MSDSKPLPYLNGALNGARAFHDWATALGYQSSLLVDDEKPVTVLRLREELEKIVAPGPVHRLVLYFAGHGLIREAEEGLWLLSDWHKELRAVAVEVLKRRLYLYGIGQIAIFADACRSLPAEIQASDLVADGVLGRGPVKASKAPPVDKFIATQDGTATFVVPGATLEEDRCVFSGVLLEALWGTKRKAFSSVVKGKITSRSLGTFLQDEVPTIAAKYGWKLDPTVLPTFPDGDDIYLADRGQVVAPKFPDWPPKANLVGQGVSLEAPDASYSVGMTSCSDGYQDIDLGSFDAGEDPSAVRSQAFAHRISSQERPRSFETECGFAVDGERVIGVWTTDDLFSESHGRNNWWRVGQRLGYELQDPAPVLIELASRLFVATTALPKFIGSVIVEANGVSALVFREIYAPEQVADHAEQIIAAMERGGIRAAEKVDLALELRQQKHADPTLGVISAYLYDSIGDVNSIQRMAAYYVAHGQPIPWDIAFLGRLQGQREGKLLRARVPDVPARQPRTDREREFKWAYEATRRCEGVVAGFWPWLRQGWSFLDDPAADGSTLLLPGIMELALNLSTSRFTTMDESGAQKLAELFGLRRQPT